MKISLALLGATGMVGQKFLTLLASHPYFEVKILAASSQSSGKKYSQAVSDRWRQAHPIPEIFSDMILYDVEDIDTIAPQIDMVLSAFDAERAQVKMIEESYASRGIYVVSNNSAHRMTPDIPMIIPEINSDHIDMIAHQQKIRGWKGAIVTKPNCSLQSYVPPLHALKEFGIQDILVSTYQAVSGAGKTLADWPDMQDNVIPYISGEEKKSESEPFKIWSHYENGIFVPPSNLRISAQCIRVPVSDGHLATVRVNFAYTPSFDQIISAWENFTSLIDVYQLPSAPQPFLEYCHENDRPQTKLDRDFQSGMGISIGRLEKDTLFDWKFVALSHNTIRGAAGGSLLLAELLARRFFDHIV